MRFFRVFIVLLLSLAATPCLSGAADTVSQVKLEVKEFKLQNGMQFLIVERPSVPQVAARIAIRAGSALEETGKTGIAHLLEHIMFKGTKNFGTLDVKKDRELQERIEAAYQTVLAEESKRSPDRELIKTKLGEMDRLRTEVQKIYVPQALSSQAERNGAVGVNAFTSKDQTQYTMSVPSDMIGQWASLMSEQLFEPSWREFYVEKEVVQREWAYRYINNPNGAAWLDLYAAAYQAHPYRNPIVGWRADMEKFNARDAMEFHRKYYNPANAVCVLVGDITLEKAKKLAGIYFERYPAGRRATEKVTEEPPQKGPRKSIRFLKGARTPLVRIGYHAAPMGTEDFYALDAMTMILSHGRSARMTQNIINKGLALGAWAGNPDNRYSSMVIFGGSPHEPDELRSGNLSDKERRDAYLKACEKLEAILLAEVEKMRSTPVTERELARVKKLNRRDFLDRMRSNESLAGMLATLEVQVGWRYVMDYLDKLERVTPDDIQRAAKKFLQMDNRTSVYVIPGGKPDRPPERYTENRSAGGSAAVKIVRPKSFHNSSIYPTPKEWKHPLSFERNPQKIEYPKAELTNVESAALFYLPDPELPLIDLAIFVKAGAVDVADGKIGLNGILNGSIIRGGTEKYTPRELAMILDENAIQLSVAVGEEMTVINLSVMKDDWDAGLSILREVLTRPRFDPEVLRVVKQEALTGLKRQGGSAGAVVRREGKIWHFKGHPYGRDPLKGLETIPGINKDDLKGFMKKYFVPSNMVMALAGDINKDKAMGGLRDLLGDLPQSAPVKRTLKDPPESAPVLSLIHKPGQVQSQVLMYLRAMKRTQDDYWKMNLLMNIFGGSNSLMYTRLRDDMGLVYGAGFFQTYKWQAGFLVGVIGCKGDKTSQAIEETVQIMQSLQREVPSEAIDQKRLDTLNSFVFNVDTKAELVNVYSHYQLRGEPLDTLEKIQETYINTEKEELITLARKYLQPQNLQIFIVADKNIRVKGRDGIEVSLEEDLKALSKKIGLPYQEIELR
ncbi:M16 family metallopeptidase [Thermodesulfobacteriota bacterium]